MPQVSVLHISTIPFSLKYIEGQGRYFADHGIEIHAVASGGHDLQQFGAVEGIVVHPVEMKRQISPLSDIVSVRSLIRLIRELRPSIVHAQTPKGGLLGMLSAWVARKPVRIYSMLGLPYMTATGNKRRLLQWTDRISCLLANEVICVSPSLREVAIRDRICFPDKIRVLRGGSANGIDAAGAFSPDSFGTHRTSIRQELGIPESAPVIGFVGRIVQDKGVAELVEAWSALRDRIPEARLLVIGPFEERDAISQEAKAALQQDPRIVLTGSIDGIAPYLAAMDILVLPSYREGLPTVLLEAASMELPVVATMIPGCVDAIQDGVTGTLVPPRDANALQAAIERYLDEPELRRVHGQAGRERVLREFRQEEIWEAIYHEYFRLLQERGRPVPQPSEASAAS